MKKLYYKASHLCTFLCAESVAHNFIQTKTMERALSTLRIMLTDRGDSELVESPPTKLMSKLCHAAYESKSNGTRVFFPKNKKLKVGTLRTLGQADAIFVSELGITPFAKKELKKKAAKYLATTS